VSRSRISQFYYALRIVNVMIECRHATRNWSTVAGSPVRAIYAVGACADLCFLFPAPLPSRYSGELGALFTCDPGHAFLYTGLALTSIFGVEYLFEYRNEYTSIRLFCWFLNTSCMAFTAVVMGPPRLL